MSNRPVPLPPELYEHVAAAITESFETVIDSTGGVKHWCSHMGAALLMYAEADAETRAKFMIRAVAKRVMQIAHAVQTEISEPDARLMLEFFGDVDPALNPHLLTDANAAANRMLLRFDQMKDQRESESLDG